jgi:hypothetical protein
MLFPKTQQLYKTLEDKIKSKYEVPYLDEDYKKESKCGWIRRERELINKMFLEEYDYYNKKEICFYGCKFSVYKKSYKNRLALFQNDFTDAQEIDFIEAEFREGVNYPKYAIDLGIEGSVNSKMCYSLDRRKEFLIIKAKELGYEAIIKKDDETQEEYFSEFKKDIFFTSNKTTAKTQVVKWNGTQTEFIELIKSLIENGTLKGKQKDIIENLSQIFGIKINNPNKLISDLKQRNVDSETIFLDKLQSSLYNYITKEKRR